MKKHQLVEADITAHEVSLILSMCIILWFILEWFLSEVYFGMSLVSYRAANQFKESIASFPALIVGLLSVFPRLLYFDWII